MCLVEKRGKRILSRMKLSVNGMFRKPPVGSAKAEWVCKGLLRKWAEGTVNHSKKCGLSKLRQETI